jgi:hypothetical protein
MCTLGRTGVERQHRLDRFRPFIVRQAVPDPRLVARIGEEEQVREETHKKAASQELDELPPERRLQEVQISSYFCAVEALGEVGERRRRAQREARHGPRAVPPVRGPRGEVDADGREAALRDDAAGLADLLAPELLDLARVIQRQK